MNAFGTWNEPASLTFQRRLPGPIKRAWSYVMDSDLRKLWLAEGVIDPRPGAHFELVWRNDELSTAATERPDGFPAESRATCTLTEIAAPHRLRFDWPGVGDVLIELDAEGDDVLLTLTHRRVADRSMAVMVGAGWHMHLDILAARAAGTAPGSFWSGWLRLRDEYSARLAT